MSQNSPYLIGLWSLQSSNVYCHNHKRLIVENQKECQDKCEDDEECVGISYGYNEMKWDLCYACKDDGLSKAKRGYGFYRKPNLDHRGSTRFGKGAVTVTGNNKLERESSQRSQYKTGKVTFCALKYCKSKSYVVIK